MRLRVLSLVWLSAALAAPLGFAAESTSPAMLGQMESVLDSCSKANPAAAADYKKQHERLVQGVPDQDLAELRASDAYKNAYREISERFEKASKADAAKTCKVFLGASETSAKDTQKDTKK